MVIKNLLLDKCPSCGKGRVFPNNNLFSFTHLTTMNDACPVCKTAFHKEPGFYWGAMYVSYALNIAEMFITYFVCRLFGTGTYDWLNLIMMLSVILVLWPFNFRVSRLIWLYIFSKF